MPKVSFRYFNKHLECNVIHTLVIKFPSSKLLPIHHFSSTHDKNTHALTICTIFHSHDSSKIKSEKPQKWYMPINPKSCLILHTLLIYQLVTIMYVQKLTQIVLLILKFRSSKLPTRRTHSAKTENEKEKENFNLYKSMKLTLQIETWRSYLLTNKPEH